MNTAIVQEYKQLVAEAAHDFWKADLTGGSDGGDVSFMDRKTGLVYLLPRPNENLVIPNWSVIRPEDVVVTDMDGTVQEDNGILPTVEAPTHLCIYAERPDVSAIVHSHGQWSSVFAITGRSIPSCLAEQVLYLGGDCKCAEYGLVGSRQLGENVVRALGKTHYTALLRNHGAVAVGKTLDEALTRAVLLEKGAETVLFGMLLGNVVTLEPDNILDPSLIDADGNPLI